MHILQRTPKHLTSVPGDDCAAAPVLEFHVQGRCSTPPRLHWGAYTPNYDAFAAGTKPVYGMHVATFSNARATMADNFGNNVGDVACRGSDLVGFFIEASCAALVISSQSEGQVTAAWTTVMFLLCISGCGILVCTACSFIAADLKSVSDVEKVLNVQLLRTALAMSIARWCIPLRRPACRPSWLLRCKLREHPLPFH